MKKKIEVEPESKSDRQKQRVISYLKRFKSITPIQAFSDLGITRLAARIFELRRIGYNIVKKEVTSVNRFGDKVTYAEYSLSEEEEND